jgi:hypothetical protein
MAMMTKWMRSPQLQRICLGSGISVKCSRKPESLSLVGFSSAAIRCVSAYSLNQASRLGGQQVTELILHPDPEGKPTDLMCVNMMCEKVGQPCVCKLAKFVSKLPKLKRLDVAGNHLKQLPDSIWDLAELEHLDVSGIV